LKKSFADNYIQSLDLAEIEGIVQEIEREKEAGEYYNRWVVELEAYFHYRGREKEIKTRCNRSWPGGHFNQGNRAICGTVNALLTSNLIYCTLVALGHCSINVESNS